MDYIKIVDFYKNQDIFITGGLGFIGKVLIEKLLRSCPDLNRIFILIRNKRDKTPPQRLDETLKSSALFDELKLKYPLALTKIIPIGGDVEFNELGISPNDFQLIKNVSIIFHSAATVRFNEPIKQSVLINTKGTYEIMKIAEKLSNIRAVVHVSTAYCNLDKDVLEEKIYAPYADWKDIIEKAEKSDDNALEEFARKYASLKHNSYTLSKHLAEQVINDYANKLPIVVFRPAIVIPVVREPIPGWIDNLNGPVGLSTGIGAGLVRTLHADSKLVAEFTPVDVSAKVMIVAAYKKGIEKMYNDDISLSVYNCSTSINVALLNEIGLEIVKENPMENMLWVPDPTVTNFYYYYLFRYILFQILPAIFLDGILMLIRKKPFVYKLQKKSYIGNIALYPFLSTQWTFKNRNIISLDAMVSQSEYNKFAFLQYKDFDIRDFLRNAQMGVKRFIFKEAAECSNFALIKYQIMSIIDRFVRILFYGWIIYMILKTKFIRNFFQLL